MMDATRFSPASTARGSEPPPALAAPRRFDPSPVLHGTILPSLLEEAVLELELSLAHFHHEGDFVDEVRRAAEAVGGVYLFELPASSLLPNARRIAVLSLPTGNSWLTVFACLDEGDDGIRIEMPDDRSQPIERFAESFVGLLGRLHQYSLPAPIAG